MGWKKSVQIISTKSWTRVTCLFLLIKKKSQHLSSSKSPGESKWLGQPVFDKTELVLMKERLGTFLAWWYDRIYSTGAGNLSLPRKPVPLCMHSTWSTSTGALDLCDLSSCSVTNLLPGWQKDNQENGSWGRIIRLSDLQRVGERSTWKKVQEKKVLLIDV